MRLKNKICSWDKNKVWSLKTKHIFYHSSFCFNIPKDGRNFCGTGGKPLIGLPLRRSIQGPVILLVSLPFAKFCAGPRTVRIISKLLFLLSLFAFCLPFSHPNSRDIKSPLRHLLA